MHNYITPFLSFLSILIALNSCNNKIAQADKPLLALEYTEPPFTFDSPVKFVEDIPYGDHQRNTFDIILPQNGEVNSLVIFIHGGGFTHGDKTLAYNRYAPQINEFLNNNMAFATINYRYLDQTERGVISAMEDSRRCLQFIRYHATSFNIDSKRIACFGSSAGAGTALWIGLNDDMSKPNDADPILRESTRVSAIGAIATQATYDIMRWEEVFEDYGISIERIPPMFLQQLNPFYGLSDFSEVHNPEIVAYRKQVDMLSLLDKDDPPIWVKNEQKDVAPMFDLQHHPAHARLLKTYADKAGVTSRFYIPGFEIEDESGEGLIEFFDRILNDTSNN